MVIFAINSFTQDLVTEKQPLMIPILDSIHFNNGIYKDYSEFISNSPSRDIKIILKRREDILQIMFGVRLNVLKYFNDSLSKYKRYKELNWGVCIDGQIYLRFSKKYLALDPVGKYSFFVNEGWARSGSSQTGGGFIYYYEYDYVIDLTTDERYRLNKGNLKEILEKEDKNLLEKFKDEKRKNQKLRDYIVKINDNYN